jgi:hypothetical protein
MAGDACSNASLQASADISRDMFRLTCFCREKRSLLCSVLKIQNVARDGVISFLLRRYYYLGKRKRKKEKKRRGDIKSSKTVVGR